MIWDAFQQWDDYEKGSPQVRASAKNAADFKEYRASAKESVEAFGARILKAHRLNEKAYLRKVIKVRNSDAPPQTEM